MIYKKSRSHSVAFLITTIVAMAILLLCTLLYLVTFSTTLFAQIPNTFCDSESPFVSMIPSSNGEEMVVVAPDILYSGADLFVDLKIGPGHGEFSYVQSDEENCFNFMKVIGFTAGQSASGTFHFTDTSGLQTPELEYTRQYLPAYSSNGISVGDLSLRITSSDTFTSSLYLAVTQSDYLTDIVPSGYQIVGWPYTILPSGGASLLEHPLALSFYYDANSLSERAQTLAIYQWQQSEQRWERRNSLLNAPRSIVTTEIDQFGTVAFISTPSWLDRFSDASGLEPLQMHNVEIKRVNGVRSITLLPDAITGYVVSLPISSTKFVADWQRITFSATQMPPTTTLTVDLLDLAGDTLLSNINNNLDLSTQNLQQTPAIRLRATLSTTIPGQTPALSEWLVAWNVGADHEKNTYSIYLPEVSR